MPIDRSAAQNDYASGAAGGSEKLVRKYIQRTDKLARAASDAAQASYKAAMSDPKVLARRQSRLKQRTEEDLNNGMRTKGQAAYSTAVQNAAPKWGQATAPYLDVIDAVVPTLPARTRDVAANVNGRVLPLAQKLRAKKDSMS